MQLSLSGKGYFGEIGVIETGNAGDVNFGHGKLDIGQAMAPPVIRKVKERANNESIVIIDAYRGTYCMVIEAAKDSNFCLLVTESALSGMHDLERVIGVCRYFGIPALVCISKYDLNEGNTRQIEDYCLNLGVVVVAKIPFDNVVTETMIQGLPVVEYLQGKVTREVEPLWQTRNEAVNG